MDSIKIDKSSLRLLPALIDEIHDRYFSVEQIEYNREDKEWKLFFGENRKGPFNKILKITKVKDYIWRDTEKIVIYDMNKITVDLTKEVITLHCNVPLVIKLVISPDFEILVG